MPPSPVVHAHDDVALVLSSISVNITSALAFALDGQRCIQIHQFTPNHQALQIPTSLRRMWCFGLFFGWASPQGQYKTIVNLTGTNSWEDHGSWLARTAFEGLANRSATLPEADANRGFICEIQSHTNHGTFLHRLTERGFQTCTPIAQVARPTEKETLDLVALSKACFGCNADEGARALNDLNLKVFLAAGEANTAKGIVLGTAFPKTAQLVKKTWSRSWSL